MDVYERGGATFDDWLSIMWFETEELLNEYRAYFTSEYTRESLGELEKMLLLKFPDRTSMFSTVGSRLLGDRAGRYIGETIIRGYGGRWDLDQRPDSLYSGMPVVFPDPDPVNAYCPASMVITAVSRRTGVELTRFFDGIGVPRWWLEQGD
ncbi:hypothetical protein [Nocardiopsis suaedae]|uniref:Uncharacterized protein n=1 Tax=Nocardiopsis suaedae TaxID=3018444 RepID=A0ABT4TV27_9ACTN|nr:hypothetical protein [Nocardiopsis suaedae]MDA2808556.1 hypothetical protein [Nocardiopsis suaedae]